MNVYLHTYIKRDTWLSNGGNYGIFLRNVDKLERQGMSYKKAKKEVNRTLWRILR